MFNYFCRFSFKILMRRMKLMVTPFNGWDSWARGRISKKKCVANQKVNNYLPPSLLSNFKSKMNGSFKRAFLVQKWQLLPCWDVLDIHKEFDLQYPLKSGGAFQTFVMALGTSVGMPSCAFPWQKMVPNKFPLYSSARRGKWGSSAGGIWGALHTLPLTWGRWGKISSQMAPNFFSLDHFALLISMWLTQEASESIYLDFFFFCFFVWHLIVLTSVSLVPVACKQSSSY